MSAVEFENVVQQYRNVVGELPDAGLAAELKVVSALKISNALLAAMKDLDADPRASLESLIRREAERMASVRVEEAPEGESNEARSTDEVLATKSLYENIWTTYNHETYDHSMRLCIDRYKANGFNEAFFKGKTVFDGGCGTGRFSLAAALMGADKVYGMDLGGKSLSFAREKAQAYGVAQRVEFLEGDVTDLSRFPDCCMDFVVSNGVLHHTSAPMQGLAEHFRILGAGGVMWLYLYGKDGLLWSLYDQLREVLKGVGAEFTLRFLQQLDVRQGMIYSFMDNCFAYIRNYYDTSYVLKKLEESGDFESSPMRGLSVLDDSIRQMESAYGKVLLGRECEVRQLVTKIR